MEKFLIKNKENIEKLDKYIEENRDDIRMMIVSPEIFAAFERYYDCTDYHERTDLTPEQMKYNGVRMVQDCYSPALRLYFVRKSESIDFNIPCMCGCYQDEPHTPFQMK